MNRQSAFDDVETGLQDLAQSKRIRHMTEEERHKREKDMQRVRGRYDMPRLIKEQVAQLADHYETSHSMAAATLLAHALHALSEQQINFDNVTREPSTSPRYGYVIPDDFILGVLNGEEEL